MSEILDQIPWQCGDERDCDSPGGWHLESLWSDDDRLTTDRFSDGDHEDVEEHPDADEIRSAWDEYYRWVINDGRDPLGQLLVPECRTVSQTWQVEFRPSIVGVVLTRCRRNCRGNWQRGWILPEQVREYLMLRPRDDAGAILDVDLGEGPLTPTETLRRLRQYCERDSLVRIFYRSGTSLKISVRLDVTVPRPELTVDRERRAAARRALRTGGAR